jgi:RHH-type transcriptional regulator, rel operon repressor / antitoxin RelB
LPSATLTIRIAESDQGRVEALARSTGRSQSSLAEEALSEFLAVNEWQISGIEAAIEDLERGGERFERETVRRWVESWGSEDELKPPGES